MLKLSLREAVSSPALHFVVAKAWLTLPDWVSRRTEIVELEDATTASHKIVLDISLPDDLRRSLTIYPQQSDEWGLSGVVQGKPDDEETGAETGGKYQDQRVERKAEQRLKDQFSSAAESGNNVGNPPDQDFENQRNGVVLLPVLFLRRGMPLPRLSITLGDDEIKATYLPKELSDTLMQGIISVVNDKPVPGPHQTAVQRFDCECPEAAWQCKRSSCPGRSELDLELPNRELKTCPPPTSALRRYEWPYCPYAEDHNCTCVKERCPAATLFTPDVIGPDDRSLASFLDSHLSTDYGMVIVAPESGLAGSFRVEIAFTRELTPWARPHEIAEADKPRAWYKNFLGLGRRWRRRKKDFPVARCGPFQGVIERASYPHRNGAKARRALATAASQTDHLKTGWNRKKGFFHRCNWIRRAVAGHGASMTIGVQTSSLGDAGTFHFVFGAPKGMHITPSGGWIHDWPAWRREALDEGIDTLTGAEPVSDLGGKDARGYTDDIVPLASDKPETEPKVIGDSNPTPYVSFLPARGIDEKVALRPTPPDLHPLAPTSETKGPNRRFSPGASLLALIQFRPNTNLPLYGILTNLLLLGIVLIVSLLSGNQRASTFLQREDAWVAILILAPALLAGLTAAREHPVVASLVRRYRIALGLTAALSLGVAVFFLVTTDSRTDESGDYVSTFVPSLFGSFSTSTWIFRALAALSLVLLGYSLFHYVVNLAAQRWADDYPVNQLDLVSPTRGFKLDTMRRPWCDSSSIRPEQALGELEALKVKYLGPVAATTGLPGSSTDSAKREPSPWVAGIDTLILSSQELSSTFIKKAEKGSYSGASSGKSRTGEMRTKEHLLEKYGVQLPDYVDSETEMVFQDGRFYERKIHQAIEGAATDDPTIWWVNLSPRHARQLPGLDTPAMVPTAADDDLDRYLMTLAAMQQGFGVIAEGCLMGCYAPPTGGKPGARWLELELKTASREQISRFLERLNTHGGKEHVKTRLEEPGEGHFAGLLGDWPDQPEAEVDWFQELIQRIETEHFERILEELLRKDDWEIVAKALGKKGTGRWSNLPPTSPQGQVRGLPARRFKGFPDLLVRRDLVDFLGGDGDYVPIDIKQGNPFSTTDSASLSSSVKLISRINAATNRHSVVLLDWFPASVGEQQSKPQYLAQLGLYSVLLQQTTEVMLSYPKRTQLAVALSQDGTGSQAEKRAALRGLRSWLTDDESFAGELAPRIDICARPGDAALWISRGDGNTSRILPVPGAYLAKELEKSVRDVVIAQAEIATTPELAGWPVV